MRFKDIKGQQEALSTIQGYISFGRMQGGYIFSGPKAVGKKMAAGAVAATLNCLEGGLDACGVCPSCLKAQKNEHPDIHLIDDPETDSVKIEDIRSLQREISLRAYEGRYKVFIINNAHNLTAEASNALLKVLEEPPPSSVIILISCRMQLLFKTVISRCKTVRFSALKRNQLEQILVREYTLLPEQAHFLAYFTQGAIGEALALKDTDIIREKNNIIDCYAVSKSRHEDGSSCLTKDNLPFGLNVLAGWFRDIYLLKTGVPHSEMVNIDRKEELLKEMSRFSFLDLEEIFNSISQAFSYREQNVNTKLLLADLKVELCRG